MFQKVLHFIPSYLPREKEEFDHFCKDVFETYGYPDKPGYRKLVAQMIQHLGQTTITVSKRQFAKAIRKAQVNENAFYMMKDADEAVQAEIERLKQEATQQDKEPAEPQPN